MKGTGQWMADKILQASGSVLCNNVEGDGRKAGLGKRHMQKLKGPTLHPPLG